MNDWNHNTAYYSWIKKKLGGRQTILDVGCGTGELVKYLINPSRKIVGIDTACNCILKATKNVVAGEDITYHCIPFEDFYPKNETYDAIIFVASLHHMDMENAIEKAKDFLNEDGILIIVGLYKPSTITDWMIEVLRIIPSFISSYLHKYKSLEEKGVPTSYDFLSMSTIRSITRENLPGAKIRAGLYFRFLLTWIK